MCYNTRVSKSATEGETREWRRRVSEYSPEVS